MRAMTRRFLLALLVGGVVALGGAAAAEVASLDDAWNWVILVVAGLAASLVDREGFYGTPPRERH